MAAVGEVASILTIAQSAKQLYDFMKSVEDAPKSILDTVEDLRVLQTIIEQIEYDKNASPTQLASAVEVLASCKLKMRKMELLLEDSGLKSSGKRRRTWASIKAVLRKEKIEAFRSSLESAKATLVLARGVFNEQANRRDVSLLTAGVNEIQSQQATRESIINVTGRVERVQEHLAYQQNSINTLIASQQDIEQHITKLHFGINQVTQTFCSTTDSLAQPFIRNALKYSITEIAHEALQDPAMRRELSRIVASPQEPASTHLKSASSNDSHDDLNRPPNTPVANVIECYYNSQSASPRRHYTRRSISSYFKYYKSIFGSIHYATKVVHRRSYEDVSENSSWHELETTLTVAPAPWLMRFGFEFVSTKMFDTRSHSLRTFRTVPTDALIFKFCRLGNVAGTRDLFQSGLASPFDRDEWGETPLHQAAEYSGYDMCAMLIQAGAPVDATDYSYGRTPFLAFSTSFHTQSEIERIKVTRLFLEESKTDVTHTDVLGQNIFFTEYGPCLEWILRNEGLAFDPLCRNFLDETALIAACCGLAQITRKADDLKSLIEAGCDVNAMVVLGLDALSYCLQKSFYYTPDIAKCRVLLQAGAKHHIMIGLSGHTHTSLALGDPQSLKCWRDTLLSLKESDIVEFLNAELADGMPLWKDGWTFHSLCGVFLTPSADLGRQDGIVRLQEKVFLQEQIRRQCLTESLENMEELEVRLTSQCLLQKGSLWEQWKQRNPWEHYLQDIKRRMRYECYLPHLGIVPKQKLRFVAPKPLGYFTLRKVWNRSLRRKCWNVYRCLPESLREYRVCTLPSVDYQ